MILDAEFGDVASKILGLECVYNGFIDVNETYSLTRNIYNAHYIYIIAYGNWNHSQLIVVFPNNGGTPKTKLIASWDASLSSLDGIEITANSNWGITVKNTGTNNDTPLAIFEIQKTNV